MTARRLVYDVLNGSQRHPRASQAARVAIVTAIALNVLAMMLATVASIAREYRVTLTVVDTVTLSFFALEYLARFWSAPERPQRARSDWVARLRWMVTPLALIDLFAIAPLLVTEAVDTMIAGSAMPPFDGMGMMMNDLALLRLVRLLSMLKVLRHSPALRTLAAVLYAERKSALAALSVMLVVLVFASTIMWILERQAQPAVFSSIPASLWWGIETLTTVGYGDMIPSTPLGRLFGGVILVMGVAMYALPAGILASGFTQEIHRRERLVGLSKVRQVPLFAGLGDAEVAEIASLVEPRQAAARQAILRRSDFVDALYVVARGRVECEVGGCPLLLREGDHFGETSLFAVDGSPPVLTATAATEVQLLRLHRDHLERLCEADAGLAEALAKSAHERTALRLY